MAEPEEKTFVTNSEMLEQVLRNQIAIFGLLAAHPTAKMYLIGAELAIETDTLLDRD